MTGEVPRIMAFWFGSAGGAAPDLSSEVEAFYYENFWIRVQGDIISEISPAIAGELFDTTVNLGVSKAVQFFQTALNMQNQGQSLYP